MDFVLNPRLHAYRPDIANQKLQGKVNATQFVHGRKGKIILPVVSLRLSPQVDAPTSTQAFYSEGLQVFEDKDGWAWVQLQRDGYVGYIPSGTFHYGDWLKMTHVVQAIGTHLYPAPDMKTQPSRWLPFGAHVTVKDYSHDIRWAEAYGGWIYTSHIGRLNQLMPDYVQNALRFVGASYLWGGKTAQGIDCSGLVQVVLQAAGYDCPRDSDMQWEQLGELVNQPQTGRPGVLARTCGHYAGPRNYLARECDQHECSY